MAPRLFRASEVCEAAGLQPYVLRSWEKEFPGIGVQRSQESPRLYRQSDLDQVLRIKQLVFGEGLTLAGARRRIEESSPTPADEAARAEILETLGADARGRIAKVRIGLQSLLDVLSGVPGSTPGRPRVSSSAVAVAIAARGNGQVLKRPRPPAKRGAVDRHKAGAAKAKPPLKRSSMAKGPERLKRKRVG